MTLTKKIFIEGVITAETGLRIGGNKSSLEIGGVDINIIKSASGEPYLPGSSLKGKLRTLLGAKLHGKMKVEEDIADIKKLFGDSGGKEAGNYTRLLVRDAPIDKVSFLADFPDSSKRDFPFSEIKTENRIDRSNGKAEHPRQIERVPSGTKFLYKLVIDIYDEEDEHVYLKMLADSFELLQMDYLGGHGSRGSGKVTITVNTISAKSISVKDGIKDIQNIAGSEYFNSFMNPTVTA